MSKEDENLAYHNLIFSVLYFLCITLVGFNPNLILTVSIFFISGVLSLIGSYITLIRLIETIDKQNNLDLGRSAQGPDGSENPNDPALIFRFFFRYGLNFRVDL